MTDNMTIHLGELYQQLYGGIEQHIRAGRYDEAQAALAQLSTITHNHCERLKAVMALQKLANELNGNTHAPAPSEN
jgi:hypothetical protein